ncbi:hypothetical protein OW492_12270 [Psychromonas sp. 14N.309.X.WAT.B.A12]|uniref:hypothetical protein n=1 Tax=Psychromonas sp. 14N.309.X.WAT.B.A12 TaxID=2998322 RepID=UPI0025B00989|nr:hypothetical protein [Psychromonas sp. 14N.309.X.WAT.B.A12]MDN2664149.1 hypothetical protein [Psychromonas sp. 14N.309.X.WAT.B.A12]
MEIDMAGKNTSIAAVACQALGIERYLLPERLRARLNYYVKDKKLKAKLLDEPDVKSESVDYVPKPIKAGNHVFIRNLVILDTLFEDKKLVINWLNGEKIEADNFEKFANEWKAKKVLFQALDKHVGDLRLFLLNEEVDWAQDEIPYPFSDGKYSSMEMIANSIALDMDSSPYDLALKAVIEGEFGKLGVLILDHPEAFTSEHGEWLVQLYYSKKAEYEEYAQLLNKY